MSKGAKNNHYHYAEQYEKRSRVTRKRRTVYAPRKAVFFALLMLLAVGLVSTTFAANFGNADTEKNVSTGIVASARSAKASRDYALTGASADLAQVGSITGMTNVEFKGNFTGYKSDGTAFSAWETVAFTKGDSNHFYGDFYTAASQSQKEFGLNIYASGWGTTYYTFNGNHFTANEEYIKNTGMTGNGTNDKLSTISADSGWIHVYIDYWGSYGGNSDPCVKITQYAINELDTSVSANETTLTSLSTTTITTSASGGSGTPTGVITVKDSNNTDVTSSCYNASNGVFTAPVVAAANTYTITYTITDQYVSEYTKSVTETITVNPLTYTVTLNTNGGTINSGNISSYTYGVGATLPTNVTKSRHDFEGWYDNSGLNGQPVTEIANNATGNKEYWAKWTERQTCLPEFAVSVDENTGKSIALGETFTNIASHSLGTHSSAITYSSSNTNVATVNSGGVVMAVGIGDAVITATCTDETPNPTASYTVHVAAPSFDIADISCNVKAANVEFAPTFSNPSGVMHGSIDYSISSGSDNVLITEDEGTNNYGTYTAKTPGTASVTATYHYSYNNVSCTATDTFSITVATPIFSVSGITLEECKSGTMTAVDGSSLSPTFSWDVTVGDGSISSLSSNTGSEITVTAAAITQTSNQTATIRLTATYNEFYAPTTTCTVTVTPSTRYILGFGAGNWGETPSRRLRYVSDDRYEVSFTIAKGEYTSGGGQSGFKVKDGGTYYTDMNVNTMTRANSTTWYFTTAGGEDNNTGLTADVTGLYKFIYHPSTHIVDVVYPTALSVTFNDTQLHSRTDSVSVTSGYTMTGSGTSAPENPSQAGYDFIGWSTTLGTEPYLTKAQVEAVNYSASVTYYANYTLITPTATLTADDSTYTTVGSTLTLTGGFTSNSTLTTQIHSKSTSISCTNQDGTENLSDAASSAVLSITNDGNTSTVYSFSADIPGKYTITYTVSITDGSTYGNHVSQSDPESIEIEVYPAAPEFTLDITGRTESGNGTTDNPYIVKLGSDIAYHAVISSPVSDYVYYWYKDDNSAINLSESVSNVSPYSTVDFGLDRATAVTSGYTGVVIKCKAECNGYYSEYSFTEAVYYQINSWITSFSFSGASAPAAAQKIFNTGNVSGATLTATYNSLFSPGVGAQTRVFYSTDSAGGAWSVIQTADGAQANLTAFGTSNAFIQTSGVKYLYLSTRQLKTETAENVTTVIVPEELDYEVQTGVIHTTVGTAETPASAPFYFKCTDTTSLTISDYRLMAFWLDGQGNLKYQTMQSMGGMYRAYLPADLGIVHIAAAKPERYGMPTVSGNVLTFSETYYVLVVTDISLNTENQEFVNGYNLYTVSDAGTNHATDTVNDLFFDGVTAELSRLS